MEIILNALKCAAQEFKILINHDIECTLTEVLDDKNHLYVKPPEKCIYVNKKWIMEVIQKEKQDEFLFIKNALIHELTHLYEKEIIEKYPNVWGNICKVTENKIIKSEILAQYIEKNINKLKEKALPS